MKTKLHITCGECGCNNKWTYTTNGKAGDSEASVRLTCHGCGTEHDLAEMVAQRRTQ